MVLAEAGSAFSTDTVRWPVVASVHLSTCIVRYWTIFAVMVTERRTGHNAARPIHYIRLSGCITSSTLHTHLDPHRIRSGGARVEVQGPSPLASRAMQLPPLGCDRIRLDNAEAVGRGHHEASIGNRRGAGIRDSHSRRRIGKRWCSGPSGHGSGCASC